MGRTCALGSLRDKGVCVFVGGQKKKAVSETWRGLETGWGEGKVLGGQLESLRRDRSP